jgi:hypothetical protein
MTQIHTDHEIFALPSPKRSSGFAQAGAWLSAAEGGNIWI